MADLPPPLLLALIPSEIVHEDSGGRYSALRFLNAVHAPSLPGPLQRVGIFVALTAVRRRTLVTVELVGPDGGIDLVTEFDLHYPAYNPVEVYQHGGNVGIAFSMHGDYRFRVSADGTMLGEWTVRVYP